MHGGTGLLNGLSEITSGRGREVNGFSPSRSKYATEEDFFSDLKQASVKHSLFACACNSGTVICIGLTAISEPRRLCLGPRHVFHVRPHFMLIWLKFSPFKFDWWHKLYLYNCKA